MSRVRRFILASVVLAIAACSDTATAPTPTPTPEPEQSLKSPTAARQLTGVWGELKAPVAGQVGAEVAGPLLCNRGGAGPECLRIFRSGHLLQRVFHRGIAQGTGCSRSIIRIAGVVRGRSGFACHVRGDVLFFTWTVGELWPFGTRIQVDFTGAGAASPTGNVFTFFGQ